MKVISGAICHLALFFAAVKAVDMGPYIAERGVDTGFARFVEEYYLTSEDKTSTDTYTSFWPTSGRMILAGSAFQGYAEILGIKQRLLPQSGNKAWWHLIRDASVANEDETSKTYMAEVVIQTTYTPGNCSQAYGKAAFTVLKDSHGQPRLEPHSQSLSLYNLTVSTTQSPTDIACTTS